VDGQVQIAVEEDERLVAVASRGRQHGRPARVRLRVPDRPGRAVMLRCFMVGGLGAEFDVHGPTRRRQNSVGQQDTWSGPHTSCMCVCGEVGMGFLAWITVDARTAHVLHVHTSPAHCLTTGISNKYVPFLYM
jgi:hypothetical protein